MQANVAADFIQEGQTVLIHGKTFGNGNQGVLLLALFDSPVGFHFPQCKGWSRVVASILSKAATEYGKNFDIIVLEGRPDAAGIKTVSIPN